MLREIYSIYGAGADGRHVNPHGMMLQARAAIARSSEFSGFEPFELATNRIPAGFVTSERMAPSTTFDGYSRAEMDRVLAQVRTYFSQDPSFCGMAIDDYDHYGALRP